MTAPANKPAPITRAKDSGLQGDLETSLDFCDSILEQVRGTMLKTQRSLMLAERGMFVEVVEFQSTARALRSILNEVECVQLHLRGHFHGSAKP